MKATIWHNPNCGTSRKTLAILQEADGVELEIIEYIKTSFTRDKLIQLFRDAGMSAKDALRVNGTDAQERGLTADEATEDQILTAMIDSPILVNRPFVETGKGVMFCRPQEKVHEIL